MSYTINTTSGNVLLTLLDGTTDSSTGLTLIGRNYTGYGLLQNDNFVRLLENFADSIPPGQSIGYNPITGTLWYDSGNATIKSYDSINWNPVSGRLASSIDPRTLGNITVHTGDQWWDTTNQQLRAWNGTTWYLIGPNYVPGQLKSGAYADTVTDTSGNTHVVVGTYSNNNLVSVTSYDATFNLSPATAAPYNAFLTINPGVNIANTMVFTGNATNSLALGNVAAINYARNDIATSFGATVTVGANLNVTNATISAGAGPLIIKNNSLNSGVQIYTNTPALVGIPSLTINGTTGLITVANDPALPLGVATKQYVDNSLAPVESNVAAQISTINTAVATLRSDYFANIASVQNVINSNLATTVASLNSNIAGVIAAEHADVASINSNIATVIASINNIVANVLPLLAPLNSPVLTGSPKAVTTPDLDASTNIATTQFVSNVANLIIGALSSAINNLANSSSSGLANGLALKANIDSPTFTGSPAASTPALGDNSQLLATTAFVAGTLATVEPTLYTSSTSGTGPKITFGSAPPNPGSGSNGDIYLQFNLN